MPEIAMTHPHDLTVEETERQIEWFSSNRPLKPSEHDKLISALSIALALLLALVRALIAKEKSNG